jgi:hypothetical protein
MNSMISDNVIGLNFQVSGKAASQACSVEDGDETLVFVMGMLGGMGECGF